MNITSLSNDAFANRAASAKHSTAYTNAKNNNVMGHPSDSFQDIMGQVSSAVAKSEPVAGAARGDEASLSGKSTIIPGKLDADVQADLKKLALPLPKWFNGFNSPHIFGQNFDDNRQIMNDLNREFGDGSQFTKNNKAPREWLESVEAARRSHPLQKKMDANTQAAEDLKFELQQYSKILNKHLDDAYELNGISDVTNYADYEAACKADPEMDERIFNYVKQQLASDPLASQLMDKIGVNLPESNAPTKNSGSFDGFRPYNYLA